MGCAFEPTGDSEGTSALPSRRQASRGALPAVPSAGGDVPAGRRRDLRSLALTAGHGLVYGLASAVGGAVVTGLIWWNQG
ncbi:hypothetical protein EDD93_0495 [Streptomyces sp. 840.1]|uniref:hypothetical protein n=1 Tax=Streptomyces sp. 840.1 TaxID=2485152 RepID=UPI000F47518B|nr:hypothetical protein [Streptomyces sp. 840.1]ROQ66095.1 hypothetical protein EDD93_0495 [Streptomyces sp. 840.1]